jgi:hypothetical protein
MKKGSPNIGLYSLSVYLTAWVHFILLKTLHEVCYVIRLNIETLLCIIFICMAEVIYAFIFWDSNLLMGKI